MGDSPGGWSDKKRSYCCDVLKNVKGCPRKPLSLDDDDWFVYTKTLDESQNVSEQVDDLDSALKVSNSKAQRATTQATRYAKKLHTLMKTSRNSKKGEIAKQASVDQKRLYNGIIEALKGKNGETGKNVPVSPHKPEKAS